MARQAQKRPPVREEMKLLCKAVIGHHWALQRGLTVDEHNRTVRMSFGCAHCTTTRVDDIARNTGVVVRRVYYYVPGFLHKGKKGDPRPSRADMRKEFLELRLAKKK